MFRVPMGDPYRQVSSTGGYPFRIEETSTTVSYIKNTTDEEKEYVAYLTWDNGGEYMIGLNKIGPGQTIEIDVKKLRDDQTPDERGGVIPPNVTTGQIKWTIRSEEFIENAPPKKFEPTGRSEQIDFVNGTSSSYACQNCCQKWSLGWISSGGVTEGEVGEQIQFTAFEQGTDCFGSPYYYQIDNDDVDWDSSDDDIATVSNLGLVTIVGVGDFEIDGDWWVNVTDDYGGYCPLPFRTLGDVGRNLNTPFLTSKSADKERNPPFPTSGSKRNGSFPTLGSSDRTNVGQIQTPLPPAFPNLVPDCEACYTKSIEIGSDIDLSAGPTVASLTASIASTRNPNVTPTPSPGTFTTTNSSITFPTESTTDMIVVFQSPSEPITIKADGINPLNVANQLKWKIDRNPADIVAQGLPSLSSQNGQQTVLTPTTAGSFRLIIFFDTNENSNFDTGEELKVLLVVVVRVIASANNCMIDSLTPQFNWIQKGTEFSISTSGVTSTPMVVTCTFIVESGGSNGRIGLNKLHFGDVGNLTTDSANVTYRTTGVATEDPGGALPMIDTGRVTEGNPPSGGETAFRNQSSELVENRAAGGQTRTVISDDQPGFGPYKLVHPDTGNSWASTKDGYEFKEFVTGYSDTFARTYFVVATATWSIRFDGNRSGTGTWINDGSSVSTPGQFSISVTNGSPQTGNSAGIQVLGLSYVNEHHAVYSQ